MKYFGLILLAAILSGVVFFGVSFSIYTISVGAKKTVPDLEVVQTERLDADPCPSDFFERNPLMAIGGSLPQDRKDVLMEDSGCEVKD